MMTSPSNRSYQEAELCNTYKDVYVKHEKILANKEKQLLEATDQVNKQENVLKCMLNQLIETFENEGLHKTGKLHQDLGKASFEFLLICRN